MNEPDGVNLLVINCIKDTLDEKKYYGLDWNYRVDPVIILVSAHMNIDMGILFHLKVPDKLP